MFVGALTLSALALVPLVLAEGNLTGLLQALNASGLYQFANITASLNNTPIGQGVLAKLSQGNNTIYVPTDEALSCAGIADLNETAVASLVSYHVIPGNFVNQTQTYPNVTVGRTLLNESNLVMLEGNKSQVLIWSRFENGSFFVENNGSNVTVVNSTSYNNTAILPIDSVLTIPPNTSTVLSNPTYNLSALDRILQSTTLTNVSTLLNTLHSEHESALLYMLDSAHGITLFAPNNAAIQAAGSSLSGASPNATALQNVFANHVINGTTVYSPELSNGTVFTSAGGQSLTFSTNSTGLFVAAGGTNPVQVVEPNVLTSNGVIHIVNGVMPDTNSNPALASSAYASATSVAAHSTVETGPVGSSTPTQAQGGAAAKGSVHNWKLGALAILFGIGLGQQI